MSKKKKKIICAAVLLALLVSAAHGRHDGESTVFILAEYLLEWFKLLRSDDKFYLLHIHSSLQIKKRAAESYSYELLCSLSCVLVLIFTHCRVWYNTKVNVFCQFFNCLFYSADMVYFGNCDLLSLYFIKCTCLIFGFAADASPSSLS